MRLLRVALLEHVSWFVVPDLRVHAEQVYTVCHSKVSHVIEIDILTVDTDVEADTDGGRAGGDKKSCGETGIVRGSSSTDGES